MTGDNPSHERPDDTTGVRWRRLRPDNCPDPIVRETPYVECKLEHPDLEPTEFGESFFPDAVPYRTATGHRVFYWRPALGRIPDSRAGLCATPETLCSVTPDAETRLDLVNQRPEGTRVVVDGTVAGDSTAAVVGSYTAPDIRVQSIGPQQCHLRVGDGTHVVSTATRTSIELPDQSILIGQNLSEETTITPQLSVRFPGNRTLCHPPVSGEYRLFPSFGLSLDDLPNPLSVPCQNGELDHDRLATTLGVSLPDFPYPVRVLWQAFAYAVFDPHRESVPDLGETDGGYLLVR